MVDSAGCAETARVQAFSHQLCHFLAELSVTQLGGKAAPWRLEGCHHTSAQLLACFVQLTRVVRPQR